MQIVGMKMDQVELRPAAIPPVQHRKMMRERVLASLVEPQGLFALRLKICRGPRVAAREQRHVMSEPEQFLGQIKHYALGAAIKLRRAAFVKRTDLCNFHGCWPILHPTADAVRDTQTARAGARLRLRP